MLGAILPHDNLAITVRDVLMLIDVSLPPRTIAVGAHQPGEVVANINASLWDGGLDNSSLLGSPIGGGD